MPRKKKSKKEEREENKKKRLAAIAKKTKKAIIDQKIYPDEPTQEEIKEVARSMQYLKSDSLINDQYDFKQEKSELQKELDSFTDPEILDFPDFLLDPDLGEERERIFKQLLDLVKNRSYFLVSIADILQTNNYALIEGIVERKKKVRDYNIESKESGDGYKVFSDFKKVVTSAGDENCPIIYAEQEDRMKSALEILMNGSYFEELAVDSIKQEIQKSAKKSKLSQEDIEKKFSEITSEMIQERIQSLDQEDIIIKIEDIIGDVIDHQDFNRACQIEVEYLRYEYNYLERLASELQSKIELQELVDSLREISDTLEERNHKYSIMDRLLTGKNRPVVDTHAEQVPSAEEGER